jgi:aminoglycoside 3-N-acetyltransferase
MLTYRYFVKAFQEVGLSSGSKVLVHVSVPALGEIAGGVETVAGALLTTVHVVITPTFTTKAMITPPFGPDDNALQYDISEECEILPEPFHIDLAADQELGEFAETIRTHPKAYRSSHPLLSFAGMNAEDLLCDQSLEDPWAPIKQLAEVDGDVLLVGASQRANVSIHYAQSLTDRKQFVRWAIWEDRAVEVPHWPGCSNGFESLTPKLEGVIRLVPLGNTTLQAIPLRDLIHIVKGWIQEDPEALLCQDPECKYCRIVRTYQKAA